MANLSARKCTVFDDSLIKLMDYVVDLTFENDKIYCLRYPGDHEEASSSLADESSIVEHASGGKSENIDGNEYYLRSEKL